MAPKEYMCEIEEVSSVVADLPWQQEIEQENMQEIAFLEEEEEDEWQDNENFEIFEQMQHLAETGLPFNIDEHFFEMREDYNLSISILYLMQLNDANYYYAYIINCKDWFFSKPNIANYNFAPFNFMQIVWLYRNIQHVKPTSYFYYWNLNYDLF